MKTDASLHLSLHLLSELVWRWLFSAKTSYNPLSCTAVNLRNRQQITSIAIDIYSNKHYN